MNYEILNALIGGGLIGLSASLMLRLNGKITGISGIIETSLFSKQLQSNLWRYLFLLGLISGGIFIAIFFPSFLVNNYHQELWLTGLGGLFVGVGTRMGGGCTSGHGVCGISRLSIRSIIATLTFIISGVITVTVLFHFLNLRGHL